MVIIPIGFTNAPAMFMCMMNNLFMNMLDKEVVVFLDDILIYSNKVEEHFKLLDRIFIFLYKYIFYCKLRKFNVFQSITTFPELNFFTEGICINETKKKI